MVVTPRWHGLVDWALHPSVRDGEINLLRRARLLVIHSLVTATLGLVSVAVQLVFGSPVIAAVGTAGVALIGVVFILLRFFGAVGLAANTIVALWTLVVVVVTALRGGFGKPIGMVLVVPPIMALVFAGQRAGAVWVVISLFCVGGLAAFRAQAGEFIDSIEIDQPLPVLTVGHLLYIAGIYSLVLAYENLRGYALRDLAASERQLETRHAELQQATTDLQALNAELELRVRDRTRELETANVRLETALADVTRLARTDSLTGLWNRRYFLEVAERELARARRFSQTFCVVLIDLDHFKRFNDSFGHSAGDLLLARVGEMMQRRVRNIDLVARYGGEEFILILPETDAEAAVVVVDRLLEAMRGLPVADITAGGRQKMTLSAGVALFPEHGADLQQLIDAADRALYLAKNAGRDQVFWPKTS